MPLWAHGQATGAAEEMARLLASWRRGFGDVNDTRGGLGGGGEHTLVDLCVRRLGLDVAAGNLDPLEQASIYIPVELIERILAVAAQLAPRKEAPSSLGLAERAPLPTPLV